MIRCYMIEVMKPLPRHEPGEGMHEFFARVSKDGRTARPTPKKGPTVYATEFEARQAIKKIIKYREDKDRFRNKDAAIPDGWPHYQYRPCRILVPVRSVTVRAAFEIPIEDVDTGAA